MAYVRRRHPDGRLHQDAVAAVLADYCRDYPNVPEDRERSHRAKRDLVGRALSGQRLTGDTLNLFISAFGINDEHAWRLRSLLDEHGPPSSSIVRGQFDPPPETTVSGPIQHETLSLFEFHCLGPDGIPTVHKTVQIIQSEVDELVAYQYRFDTDAVTVTVHRGGRAGPVYRLPSGLWAVDITLIEPLPKGCRTDLEYETRLHYDHPPPPEVRRAVRRRVRNIGMSVQFDPALLPRAVWCTHWDSLDGTPVLRQQIELNRQHKAFHFWEEVEHAIVGFTWKW
jgi:hypothetical protein